MCRGSDGVVSLAEITEDNFTAVCSLKTTPAQEGYAASPLGILARAYAKRNRNARALAIADDETIVGVLMYMDLFEEPACYTIEQFLIDQRYQGRGYGKQALQQVVDILAKEKKYEAVEICVKTENTHAVKMYESAGFVDTGYIDPDVPDSYCLRYTFDERH
jgi:ribosomal protein S18 acetylase RimI-like enzyme